MDENLTLKSGESGKNYGSRDLKIQNKIDIAEL